MTQGGREHQTAGVPMRGSTLSRRRSASVSRGAVGVKRRGFLWTGQATSQGVCPLSSAIFSQSRRGAATVRSSRLNHNRPVSVTVVVGKLGGGAKRRSNGQRLPRISMMTTVAQRLAVRYVLMVAVAGAIFLSGIVFHEHLPRRVPVALAAGGLVLGVVVCGFWFRAALGVRTDACPHCQYRFVPGELRPSRCAECGKPTTVN